MNDIITMSKEAIKQALHIQGANDAYRNLNLRLYIEGKGCDGFYYGVSFDTPKHDDLSFQQDDKIEIIIDPDSFLFCKGSHIIWVDDERGSGFLVENPNQKKFRGKFYKRKAWQDFLNEKSNQN